MLAEKKIVQACTCVWTIVLCLYKRNACKKLSCRRAWLHAQSFCGFYFKELIMKFIRAFFLILYLVSTYYLIHPAILWLLQNLLSSSLKYLLVKKIIFVQNLEINLSNFYHLLMRLPKNVYTTTILLMWGRMMIWYFSENGSLFKSLEIIFLMDKYNETSLYYVTIWKQINFIPFEFCIIII